MKTVAAVTHRARAQFVLEDIDLPSLGDHDILVRIAGVGICHTDLASRDGLLGAPFPSIFGHEGAGVVERIGGRVTKLAVGDHVVLGPASDGQCPMCQTGAPMYCDRFNDLNFQTNADARAAIGADERPVHIGYFGQSSFAHHALGNERSAVKVSRDVPLALLGPLGCGIQTGAGTVMNGLRPRAGASIVVLGAGTVGLSAILAAVVCGCTTIVAVDRSDERLRLATSLGATHSVDTNDSPDLANAIREIVPRGADFVVDTAGVPSLVVASLGGLARLGTLGLVAVPPTTDANLEVPWFAALLQGHTVRGFVEGDSVPDVFIPHLVELFQAGRFPFDKLIRRYPFEQINGAVADQQSGRTIKAVLETDAT